MSAADRATPPDGYSAALAAVQRAWQDAHARADADDAPFVDTLEHLAAAARAGGVTVVRLLRALDRLAGGRYRMGGKLQWDHARQKAGRRVIRTYSAEGVGAGRLPRPAASPMAPRARRTSAPAPLAW